MENMGLTAATLFYNTIMAVLVILASFWFATVTKEPDAAKGDTDSSERVRTLARVSAWPCVLGGVVVLAVIAVFLSVVFSLPYFDPLRAARFLCFGWFLHVPLFVLLAAILGRKRGLWILAALITSAVAGVVVFAFFVEPFRLEISHHRIVTDKVSRRFKVGVLADFQTDKFETYERESLRRFMQEKPDLIVMAGDYLQADSQEKWELLRDTMNADLKGIGFAAPLGVYGVGGNTDFQRWPEIFRDMDVATFRATRTLCNGEFAVSGLSIEDSFEPRLRLPRPEPTDGMSAKPFHIVLGHAPDFALSPDVDGDLFVAGHTHGGQVRLPWLGPLVTFSRVPRSWAAGLTKVAEDKWLMVSRGVGMERRDAPRMRFLCRPQLVFIELVPQDEAELQR